MTDIIQLKESSYKKVSFLSKEMPTKGGRRIVQIRYPRSDKQSIEDQGLIPRKFSITAVIPHEDYYNERDNLLRVLEDGEKGTLIHPTFGSVENVKAGTYTLEEKINELGRAEISMEFFIDDSVGTPISSSRIASKVQSAVSTFDLSLVDDFTAGYGITSTNTGNYADAIQSALGVPESFSAAIKKIQPLADEINDFSSLLNGYTNNVSTLVNDPISFVTGNVALFASLNNLYSSATNTFSVITEMFGFGDDDPVLKQDTAGRIERTKNRDLLRDNIKGQALSGAYLASVQIEYTNENDLLMANDSLEAQYNTLRESPTLSNQSLLLLDDLRVQANAALSEALLNTRKVITINTRRIPLSVLVYKYYGSTELVPTIADINNIKYNAFVEGDVEILTA